MHHYKIDHHNQIDKRFINNRDKALFIPKEEAYSEMIKLITTINQQLWSGDKASKLYFTEMLLFAMADTIVIKEITANIALV